MPVAVLVQLRHFYRDHHHHHHHHHHCSLYLRNDQQIWITTKIHIFTKGFKHIECGHFLRDHAGFHEHNEPRVVLDKLWHDIINSHTVTKHACTFSCLPLATQYTKYRVPTQSLFPGKVLTFDYGSFGPGKVLSFSNSSKRSWKSPYFLTESWLINRCLI